MNQKNSCRQGVILYGPPASGKDTVTAELMKFDLTYSRFRRLKIDGSSAVRQQDYRVISRGELDSLSDQGLVLYSNERYGNVYAVDRPGLDDAVSSGQIPILHLGQIEGMSSVSAYPIDWTRVLLWCTRSVSHARAIERGSADVDQRMQAWDATLDDLQNHPNTSFNLAFRTDHNPASVVASTIHDAIRAGMRTEIDSDQFLRGLT